MFVIRGDGNAHIGAGHLMRCLTIADALAHRTSGQADIMFICGDDQSGQLAADHFRVQVLHTDYQDMEAELPVLVQLLSNVDEQIVFLIDSYYVTPRYIEEIKRLGYVFLLDDMGKQPFPADAVINYNAFADKAVYRELYQGMQTELHIGSSYIPLRPQFLHTGCQIREKVSDVLITTGGGDSENIGGSILEGIYDETLNYHLITGRYHPYYNILKTWEKNHNNVTIYHDVKDMASLMAKCDLAVTAGGTTIYELAAVGVPFICFSYADNQKALTAWVGETTYTGQKIISGYAGDWHEDKDMVMERISKWCQVMKNDIQKRQLWADAFKNMVDGHGAERIADLLRARQ